MTDPTVQVPVPLREQVQALRDEMFAECDSEDHLVPLALLIERLDALLSQPTPTIKRHTHNMGDPDEWHVTRCKVCGLAASVEFVREQCRYPDGTADQPRIEDMAPGTTFAAQLLGGNIWYRLRVPKSGERFYIGASARYVERDSIDPSTICDVTPPRES